MKESNLARVTSPIAALELVGKSIEDERWHEILYDAKSWGRGGEVFVKNTLELTMPISGIPVLEQSYHRRLRAVCTVAALKEVAQPTIADVSPNRKAAGAEAFSLEGICKPRSNARAIDADVQLQTVISQLSCRTYRLLITDHIVVVLCRSVGMAQPGLHRITEQASNRWFIEVRLKSGTNVTVRPCEKLVGMEAKPLEVEAPHFTKSDSHHILRRDEPQ
jgi:hypothetical protein